MNTKTFIVWFLLLAAVVLAVATETSLDNKNEGATVEERNYGKDSLNNEINQKGWRGGGGRGGGWRGGGGRGGRWRGGGGRGRGWRGGGGGGRTEVTTEQVHDDKSDISIGVTGGGFGGFGGPGGFGGWGGPGGFGGFGGPGGFGGWGGPWRGGFGGWGGPWRGGFGGWGGPGGGWIGGIHGGEA